MGHLSARTGMMGAMDIAGWEQRYRSAARENDDAATPLVVELGEKLAPGKAVDLACGTGRNALYLAARGWSVMAVDGSQTAIDVLRQRATVRGLDVQSGVADLAAADFKPAQDAFDLVLIAYYLQRDLFAKVKAAVRPGGVVAAIVHTPEPGEPWSKKRARPGELWSFFDEWKILWDYEGPSRDPAHRRPVAEVVARRPAHS
jgi:tellurite methyltransferase